MLFLTEHIHLQGEWKVLLFKIKLEFGRAHEAVFLVPWRVGETLHLYMTENIFSPS